MSFCRNQCTSYVVLKLSNTDISTIRILKWYEHRFCEVTSIPKNHGF